MRLSTFSALRRDLEQKYLAVTVMLCTAIVPVTWVPTKPLVPETLPPERPFDEHPESNTLLDGYIDVIIWLDDNMVHNLRWYYLLDDNVVPQH